MKQVTPLTVVLYSDVDQLTTSHSKSAKAIYGQKRVVITLKLHIRVCSEVVFWRSREKYSGIRDGDGY